MSPENKAHFLVEKEAVHLILTGIRDDIYSTVDACQTAHEMWEAIKRLQQGQRLISLTTSAGMVKQYQIEVNELRAEKLARKSNPLALVATAQASQDPFYQTSRHKGKEIAKPITPSSETASEEDSDPGQAQRDMYMQKNLALIAKYFKNIYKPTNNNLITSLNSKNKNVDTTPRFKNDKQKSGIQCFNCKEYGHFAKECRKLKRVKDSAYHKEKMLLCKQAEQAHYNYMAKIQEVPNADSGTDSEPVKQNDQNDVESDDERVMLANLKLDVDENKKIQKQLKKANTTLAQELKECKAILAETSQSLRESISVRDSCLVALQTKQTEFEKYKAFND
nr:hypothetical protein [Tanacetum cinerariifolium]